MREKAEARAKAKAEAAASGGDAARVSMNRKKTIARLLSKEEQRIETGSQIAGA